MNNKLEFSATLDPEESFNFLNTINQYKTVLKKAKIVEQNKILKMSIFPKCSQMWTYDPEMFPNLESEEMLTIALLRVLVRDFAELS